MKNLLGILPGIILGCSITAMNLWGARLSVMRPISLGGLLLMAIALYLRRKNDGLSDIERGFFLYVALNAVLFWGFPGGPARMAARFPATLVYTVLFLVVALPALFAGRYFTLFYAKKSTPEPFWGTDLFRAINRNMTWAWAGLLAVCTLITLLPAFLGLAEGLFTSLLFQMILPTAVMIGAGRPFNRLYPEYYKKKAGLPPAGPPAQAKTASEPIFDASKGMHKKEGSMSRELNVVAVNGSPHGAMGNTSQMIQMVASALSGEGITVDEIILSDKRIEYCVGCGACLEKTRCWRQDDHAGITEKLLAADGIILASPVYFMHVTAQMKAFIDRSLSFGHKPRAAQKPGLAVCVSAGLADTETARYLEGVLHVYGAYSVGNLTAMATSPGGFLGKETVEARAKDLARDLARAIREGRRPPVTGDDLRYYLFMRDLVTREKEFMKGDYRHWQEAGLLEGFEAFVQQRFTVPPYDPAMRTEWLKTMIREETAKTKGGATVSDPSPAPSGGTALPKSCLDLMKGMPSVFKSSAAGDMKAVYQFEVSGSEAFVAHLAIAGGSCTFHEGPAEKPDVVIKTPAEVWLAVSKGEMDGQAAFMSGKYKVEGNIALLLKLKSLFG